MATKKNKLPVFGINAKTDDSIVSNVSNLKNTGFVPNTVISSEQMNTYLKILINCMNALIDAIYNDSITENDITANSSITSLTNYLKQGMNATFKSVKVSAAESASKLDDMNVGNDIHPIYFKDGIPLAVADTIDVNIKGNANTASSLKKSITITFTDDMSGSFEFDGSTAVTANITVNQASSLKSKNIGDTSHPVYFDDKGKPIKIEKVASADEADNASNSVNASNVVSTIGGKAISSIFETDGITVKEATKAKNANITNNDTEDNANINIQIGNGIAYTKTINNVDNAKLANVADKVEWKNVSDKPIIPTYTFDSVSGVLKITTN